jgi:GMP synthase (glutamine-hydrolysing)
MTKAREALKILLLQIRDEAHVRQEELNSFAHYSQLNISQFHVLNVFDEPHFTVDIVDGYDALFVGGASEASVLEPENYSFLDHSQNLLRYCLEKDVPVFASCFGFQLAVLALGGEVVRDRKHYEMGVIPIQLSPEAAQDTLFHDIPNHFLAVSVHQEKSTLMPPGCTTLALTKNCIHAFRVNNKAFWAFQFHPEVDKDILIERLTIFKQKYTQDDSHLQSVLSSAKETPESNGLMKKFVDRVLLKNAKKIT